jgi:maltose/moltooligosaccharide transporter
MFTVYNGVAAAVAFLLPVLAKRTSNKFTHMLALVFGGFGLISIYFLSDKVGLLLAMIGVGIAWASILSIPYAMLSGALPAQKMGYYMGVFNFFVVIPQIVAGTILGFLVKTFFNNEPIYALIIGGISMILAGFLTLTVTTSSKININE